MPPPHCSRCSAPVALARALGTGRCALCQHPFEPATALDADADLGDPTWLVEKRLGKTRAEWVLLFPVSLPALGALIVAGVWVGGTLSWGPEWGVDNWSALSVSLTLAGIWILVGAWLLLSWSHRRERVARLAARGVAGVGIVQTVTHTSHRAQDGPVRLRGRWLTLTVSLPGAPPFVARSKVYLGRDEWERVRPGATVRLLADPNDPTDLVALQILTL